jgi:CRISPR type IV-associated protein Csf1
MKTIPQLIFTDPQRGNIFGHCVFCNQDTQFGWRVKDTVSDNFTGWSNMMAGDCACEYCHQFFSDQIMRRKSWVATDGNLRILEKEEKKTILFEPPKPPFFIYLVFTGQKQGWIGSFQHVAYSQDAYYFAHEKRGEIFFIRKLAEEYRSKIRKALGLKIKKTELKQDFRMKTWERAWKEDFEHLLREIEKFKHNNLWEVLVELS